MCMQAHTSKRDRQPCMSDTNIFLSCHKSLKSSQTIKVLKLIVRCKAKNLPNPEILAPHVVIKVLT